MLFHAAGAEGSRPTFFEMAAADFLPASLKAAALYALGVLAQHRPSLHRLLDHSDELSAAALLLLEWHSLKTHGASFGESMYGLRRISTVPHRPSPSQAALRTEAAAGKAEGAGRGERAAGGQEGGSASYGMSRKQGALSLLFLVLLPYLRTKLHSLFAARQRQRQARTLWVGEDDGGDDGWGGTGEEEWRRGRDGANHAGLGQGDGYGGAMGGEERSESGSSPASMGSVGSVHGHEQLDDGLGSAGWRDETRGGEGVAAAAARVTDGRAEGGAGEEEADGQGGQVVTGGATAGNSDARNNGGRRSSAIGSSRSSARGSRRWRQVLRVLRWVQRRAVRGAAAAYPWVQAPYEGLCLLYQLLYVMDATPHYSPVLHLLSLSLRRATTQELAEASSSISTRRQREFERLPGSPAIKAVQAVLLKALYFTMDYAQTSVIAVVFAFKMAEWWYQTGEQKLSAPTVYPPPPPPPPPK
ncbi:unnamed protein product, partial [Closterium sp. NIES-53]